MTSPKTRKKTPDKPPAKSAKAAPELSPIECKEHLDQVLEMQKEVALLERRQDDSHKVYKEHKERFELKRDELLTYLKGLNEEHPLFDDHNTIDIPWPFPLPDGTEEATLADVAADPIVMGLSVSVVKSVREKIACSTLGQLQEYLQAGKPLSPAEQAKGKKHLGVAIGPSQAQKLLRAVASFNGGRTKTAPRKGKAAETSEARSETKPAAKETETTWRETKVADLEAITPMQAQLLGQLQMATVGQVLDRFKILLQGMPVGGPPDYLKKQLATFMAVTVNVAGKIIDVIYAFEEEHVSKAG